MEPEFVLWFGSRGGSAAALGFFAVLFGALGWAIVRECRRRGVGVRPARAIGLTLSTGLLAAVWATSLGGFYELRGRADGIETRGLLPALSSRLAWAPGVGLPDWQPDGSPGTLLARVEAEPAFRGRWRLVLVDAAGGRIESATADRDTVESAAALLRGRILTGR